MFNKNDILVDKNVCLGLARDVAPEETGNVKFNAMRAITTPDGFAIVYSLADAFYIYFLEEGTRYSTKHVGFIANRTVPLLAEYLFSKYDTKDKQAVMQFENRSMYGNFDNGQLYGGDYLRRRDERNLQSRLLDMQTHGHMSNVFGWQHDTRMERPTPAKFQER